MSDLDRRIAELLDRLLPEEVDALDAILATEQAECPWTPDRENKPQCMAYESKADVIGFGGAAGGGKTDLAIGMALTRHEVVQFMRRESTELGAVIDRIAQVLGGNRKGLNAQRGVWRDPTPHCRTIEFGSVPHPGDESAYQGRPKDLLVIDEAANFLESQVRFLMGWVRTTTEGQACRTLLTFNPPTSPEGRWVIDYFAPWLDDMHPRPAAHGELRWFAVDPRGKDVEVPDSRPFVWRGEDIDYTVPEGTPADRVQRPQSRTFIASRVTDNRFLHSTGYITQLQSLPEPLRSKMLLGDFKAGTEDDPMQVIPTAWVDAAMARWKRPDRLEPMDAVGVDVALGGRDWTVIARRHGRWYDAPIAYEGHRCPDGPTVAAYVMSAKRDDAPIHIDLFGVGAQPYGVLCGAQQQVHPVVFGDPSGSMDASGRFRFRNMRSQLWWQFREQLDPNSNSGIALPPDRRLRADLCAPRWNVLGNIIQVESRDEIVKRIGRSPDWGTAYICAQIIMPKQREMDERDAARAGGRHTTYDPIDLMRRRRGVV